MKTSWRRLEDVFWRRRRKTSSRRLQDVFIKMNVCRDLSQHSAKNIRQKENDSKEVTVINFMAYWRKIPLKTLQLKLFQESAKHLLDIFLSISWHSQRVDIIFDVYEEDNIKAFERNRRISGTRPIEIEIIQDSTSIPVDMSSFWGSSSNKKTIFYQMAPASLSIQSTGLPRRSTWRKSKYMHKIWTMPRFHYCWVVILWTWRSWQQASLSHQPCDKRRPSR